ncbi:MAG: hypothetical protein ABJN03_01940 [Ascidiaceihabitans sp.]|uniref:hypothetical protein n=1 Tax=Ascidiaceihabitans sp. TaxID=1872644 RepID=UPI0032983BE3
MRFAAILIVLGLGACDPGGGGPTYTSDKQQPSKYEPGVTVSGHAKVGVKRSF